MSTSIHPPIHPSIQPSTIISTFHIHPTIHSFIQPSNHKLIHPTFRPTIHPSIQPSTHLSNHPLIHPPFRPTVHTFIQLSTHPPIHPFTKIIVAVISQSRGLWHYAIGTLWLEEDHHHAGSIPPTLPKDDYTSFPSLGGVGLIRCRT